MILWHAGLSLAIVWNVFRDPAIDHRLVVAGALLPDLIDLAWGRRAVAHTLFAPVAVLTVVMLATSGRRSRPVTGAGAPGHRAMSRQAKSHGHSHRLLRRRLLALPIGMFLHLVLDASWTETHLMWWPLSGTAFPEGRLVPGFPLVLALEIVGAWALGWFVWRFGLDQPGPRRYFFRSGRLQPAVER